MHYKIPRTQSMFFWLLVTLGVCYKEVESNDIQTCRNEPIQEIVVQYTEKPVNFSLCFVNVNVNTTKVELKNSLNVYNSYSDKYTFNWRQSSNYSYILDILILNISELDLTEWILTLKEGLKEYRQSLFLSSKEPQCYIDFSVAPYIYNNVEVYRITCTGKDFPRRIQLIDRCANSVILETVYNSRNLQRKLTLHHEMEISPFKEFQLALECKVYDFKNITVSKFQDIKTKNEPAQMCSIQDPVIKANVHDTAKVRVQVLAFPEISVFVTKDTKPNLEDKQWKVNSRKLSEVLWSIELFKDNIREEDMGNYSVKIKSSLKPPVQLNISVVLKDSLKFLNRTLFDLCSNTNIAVIYRLVSSGLPLSQPTNMPYKIDIVPNNLSRQYLVKLYIVNCTQFLGKQEKFTLKAGSKDLIGSFYLQEKYNILSLCKPRDQEINLTTRISENVEFNICLISESQIDLENIVVDLMPYALLNFQKYQLDITNEGNKFNIHFIIKQVTREDIKFYFIRLRNRLKYTMDLVLNLFLLEEPPYLCDQATESALKDQEIEARFCIRSYPVLSRDIFINENKYTINGTNEGVSIDSTIDEESFANYLNIKIPNVTGNLIILTIKAISVTNLSFTFHLNITTKYETTTILSTQFTQPTTSSTNTETTELSTFASPEITKTVPNIVTICVIVIVIIMLASVLVYFFCPRRQLPRNITTSIEVTEYVNIPVYMTIVDVTEVRNN